MIYIGIDPGKDGAIAYVTSKGTTGHIVVPKIAKEYDLQKMCDTLQGLSNGKAHAVLEKINGHVAMSRSSAFTMGKGCAYWEAFLVALKIPHTLVPPQTWQKEMWAGITVQRKAPTKGRVKGSVNTKATSLLAAKKLFPDDDFTKSPASSVPHDGIVDAKLIAEYARRKF